VKAIDLFGGRLFVLGGVERIDGTLSWRHPRENEKFEPINAYLRLEGSSNILVEAGVAAHSALISKQLKQVSALRGRKIEKIAITRNEPDCLSNMKSLVTEWGVRTAYVPGVMNPIEFFDDASGAELLFSLGVETFHVADGDFVDFGQAKAFEVTQPVFRLLPTSWLYDPETKTLFCSDAFTEVPSESPDDRIAPRTYVDSIQQCTRHLLQKFDWLERADTRALAEFVKNYFLAHEVEVLAPTRGCLTVGKDAVSARVDNFLRALEMIAN
jgi:flavorubredoxin